MLSNGKFAKPNETKETTKWNYSSEGATSLGSPSWVLPPQFEIVLQAPSKRTSQALIISFSIRNMTPCTTSSALDWRLGKIAQASSSETMNGCGTIRRSATANAYTRKVSGAITHSSISSHLGGNGRRGDRNYADSGRAKEISGSRGDTKDGG